MNYKEQGIANDQPFPVSTKVPSKVEYQPGYVLNPELATPSKIRDITCFIEESLRDLNLTIEALEQRLDTVVVPTARSVSNAAIVNPSPSTVESHYGYRIADIHQGILVANIRLQEMMNRIEV